MSKLLYWTWMTWVVILSTAWMISLLLADYWPPLKALCILLDIVLTVILLWGTSLEWDDDPETCAKDLAKIFDGKLTSSLKSWAAYYFVVAVIFGWMGILVHSAAMALGHLLASAFQYAYSLKKEKT